ncbi:hypothetical protein TREMEDRAFT_64477 [Tremella mesenterica DSM 1558]|uniref:uncharacterized protein n=1 Tax=Tremella mesenterica (strain ATCC 24925 / CBS 8224 / DSM 1558 / NBRC 9311 / NRRL Y-6157 / RJB 2259-6 / UBC 559-6) TaxID=578456 RepID=UPI0003F4959C|nr:uncharacterized protein TREMEDRAFT_64477 [Tremella mesenterica DSM 1558]EIW67229.1 hypothetical protein TREMEDRAFT_64477 [Tremella mesenterica DSM 1558]
MSEQETAGPSRCPSNQARSLEMNVSNLPSDDSPRSFDDFLDSLMLPDTLSELKDGHNLSKTDPIHWETLKQAVLQTSTLPLEDLPHALYTGVPGKKSNDPSSDILTLLNTMENAILNSLQTTAPDSTRTNVGDAPAQEFHFDQHSLASSVGPDRNHFKKNKRRGGDILPKRTSLVIGPADGAKSQASTEVSQEWRKPGGKKSKPFRPKGCECLQATASGQDYLITVNNTLRLNLTVHLTAKVHIGTISKSHIMEWRTRISTNSPRLCVGTTDFDALQEHVQENWCQIWHFNNSRYRAKKMSILGKMLTTRKEADGTAEEFCTDLVTSTMLAQLRMSCLKWAGDHHLYDPQYKSVKETLAFTVKSQVEEILVCTAQDGSDHEGSIC